MSDEQPTADAPLEGESATDSQPEQSESEPEVFDREYVQKLRQESARYRTEAKANAEAAKRLAEIEEANKSDAEKAADALRQQTERADKAESALARFEVASEKNIPAEALPFLTGTTREELEAQAESVLTLIKDAGKPRTPLPDPAQGRESGNPSSGDWLRDQLSRGK